MRNEKYSRGPAVSDDVEAPSDRANLVIVLRNETTGQQAVWHRKDKHADHNNDHTDDSNPHPTRRHAPEGNDFPRLPTSFPVRHTNFRWRTETFFQT